MTSRRFIPLVGVVVLAATLTGCALFESSAQSTDTFADVTEVRLDAGNGSVTIRGADVSETKVRRDARYTGWDEPEVTHAVEGGVLTLRGCGDNCRIEYDVSVPAGTPVIGTASNGNIVLADLGTVDVATSNGRVEVDGAEVVTAESSNGAIEVRLDRAADITARTSNGPIEVTVPSGGYAVSTETSNGDTEVGVADDPDAEHRLDLHTSNGDITVVGR